MRKRTHKHRCGYVPDPKRHKGVGFMDFLMLTMAQEDMARERPCGFVWEHERPPASVGEEEYRKRHLCPNCGTHNTFIYKGRLKPGQGRKP